MPLDHYGVAIGSLVSFTRDPQHNFGSWYHGHVQLDAAGVSWTSALDVDAPSAVGVLYRLVTGVPAADLGAVSSMAPGFHDLPHDGSSGALDYVRSHSLQNGWVISLARRLLFSQKAPSGWTPPAANVGRAGGPDSSDYGPAPFKPDPIDSWLKRWLPPMRYRRLPRKKGPPYIRWRSFPWIESTGDNALDALAPHLASAERVYLFGQRYTDGTNGVHDVHMNQGDPAGSQWFASNGSWQDGGVACQKSGGTVVIWQVRFKTQSMNTDTNGHPV